MFLADIQEFYELTLLDETKSIQQKTMETLQIASKWELESTKFSQPVSGRNFIPPGGYSINFHIHILLEHCRRGQDIDGIIGVCHDGQFELTAAARATGEQPTGNLEFCLEQRNTAHASLSRNFWLSTRRRMRIVFGAEW